MGSIFDEAAEVITNLVGMMTIAYFIGECIKKLVVIYMDHQDAMEAERERKKRKRNKVRFVITNKATPAPIDTLLKDIFRAEGLERVKKIGHLIEFVNAKDREIETLTKQLSQAKDTVSNRGIAISNLMRRIGELEDEENESDNKVSEEPPQPTSDTPVPAEPFMGLRKPYVPRMNRVVPGH